MVFLREYVYVDVDKVRGLVSQIDEGVPEKVVSTEAKERHAEIRNRHLGGAGGNRTKEDTLERSMADSLFKILEEDLEALQLLTDLSEPLSSLSEWKSLEFDLVPGAIVRVTALGSLFHPAQLSHALVGIATASSGIASYLDSLNTDPSEALRKRPSGNRKGGSGGPAAGVKPLPRPGSDLNPEDLLPNEKTLPVLDIPREQLAGIIQFVRGIYDDGVHLHMWPRGKSGPSVTARLESGRRFLDSSPEVLFSRYGIAEQEWTIVGVIGQLGRGEPSADAPESSDNFSRSTIIEVVEWLLAVAGKGGLVDSPVAPGFTVVPLAVYRSIGRSATSG
ncbi:DUF6414 family protein [Rhodococcus sp. 06-235-1A]|uniref:DUF6414 family protein n=1 Tax=Rhodococcus sp. 06-235-1A TaxID=2022508 RepID=UPI001179D265|nr:hypothetical protein [Rhodococcus sp. 06-235-1A]